MNKFKIVETENFLNQIQQSQFQNLYSKINDYVYPILRNNPYFHNQIKKLKGEWKGFYRFRLGNDRLFYKLDTDEMVVYIMSLQNKKKAYQSKK